MSAELTEDLARVVFVARYPNADWASAMPSQRDECRLVASLVAANGFERRSSVAARAIKIVEDTPEAQYKGTELLGVSPRSHAGKLKKATLKRLRERLGVRPEGESDVAGKIIRTGSGSVDDAHMSTQVYVSRNFMKHFPESENPSFSDGDRRGYVTWVSIDYDYDFDKAVWKMEHNSRVTWQPLLPSGKPAKKTSDWYIGEVQRAEQFPWLHRIIMENMPASTIVLREMLL
jgi:hypothetical protein